MLLCYSSCFCVQGQRLANPIIRVGNSRKICSALQKADRCYNIVGIIIGHVAEINSYGHIIAKKITLFSCILLLNGFLQIRRGHLYKMELLPC
jgi:hypothetical protein